MKLTTFAAALATAATVVSVAQAGGVVFSTPVTYTEPITYAAGVTYLAAVTYSPDATVSTTPVMLERVVVTPTRSYSEAEWHVHLASKKAEPQLYPVRSERRYESHANNPLRILLPLQ